MQVREPIARRDASQRLVKKLIERGARTGLDQKTLAERAGISPEQLSRLKRTGACRLETVLRLARAVGLTELELREPSRHSAASLAARKLSAGRPQAISAEELVRSLRASAPARTHRAHLLGFFEELPIESVHDVILEGDLDYTALFSLAKNLGAEGETSDWLAEMALDCVA